MKKLSRSTVAVVAVCLLIGAVGASSAIASETGVFFNASTVKLATPSSLTVKKNGAEAKTCKLLEAVSGTAATSSGSIAVYNNTNTFMTELWCSNEKAFGLDFDPAIGKYNTVTGAYSLNLPWKPNAIHNSPFGVYTQAEHVAAGWTNGTETTPSTINFNETVLGTVFGGTLTVTGTITATTSTGGLLAMSH